MKQTQAHADALRERKKESERGKEKEEEKRGREECLSLLQHNRLTKQN